MKLKTAIEISTDLGRFRDNLGLLTYWFEFGNLEVRKSWGFRDGPLYNIKIKRRLIFPATRLINSKNALIISKESKHNIINQIKRYAKD